MKQRRRKPRLAIPPWPFLAGTFTFPFSRDVRGRCVALAFLAISVGLLAREGASLAARADGRLSFLGSIFIVLTVMATVAWLAFASACAAAIVTDTANGCDRIARWPGALFLDWIGESLLVGCGFLATAAAGFGVALLLRGTGRPNDGVAAIAAFVLFPVVLLSMFENESIFEPLSWPVCRTVGVCPDAWGAFYACMGMVVGAAASILVLVLPGLDTWGIVLSGVAVAVAWLVIFRLLGRLALCSAVRSAPPIEEDDAPPAPVTVLEDPMERQRG